MQRGPTHAPDCSSTQLSFILIGSSSPSPFFLSMTDTGSPGLLLLSADRSKAGYMSSSPSFPALLRGEFSSLVAPIDPLLPQPTGGCSSTIGLLCCHPPFPPPFSWSSSGCPGQCWRLRPNGLTSAPGALGWDVPMSQ